MATLLKLFIDGIEVKKGDKLIRDKTIIEFDHMTLDGGILCSELKHWTAYSATEDYYSGLIWKFYKEPEKYAHSINVKRDENGEILYVEKSREMFTSRPKSSNPNLQIYWPESDYLDSYGFFKIPEEKE